MNPRGKVYAGQHDYGYLPYPDANYDTRAMAHALQPHVPSIEQPLREYESLLAQTKKDVETLGGHFVGEMYVPSGNPSNHPRRGTSVDAQLCIVTLGLYGLYALWRDRGRGYTASEERHYQLQNAHQKVRDALYIALHQRAEDQNGGEEK
ncbi:hypothetical protein HY639_03780 [Candidatus Woesearchaeota archaeon]|nr:hypothetical protein [Candidatus Woesearchaeota archaeon]